MSRDLLVRAIVALSSCIVTASASGQIVEGFPLHAVQDGSTGCDIGDPCTYGPNTMVYPGIFTVVYIWTRNVEGELAGLQTAFDWEPESWTLISSEWSCQDNQVTTRVPSGPGPGDGTVSTTFDCVAYGASLIIGKLSMMPSSGWLRQVQSALPFGTSLLSCDLQPWSINPEECGTICVDEPGLNACWPQPVGAVTWGAIKSEYR